MELKLAYYYAALLSVAAFVALCDAQMPPASTSCLASNLMTGGDFVDCCPAADPNDGICTLIWCIDIESAGGSLIRDNCGCGDVETACSQLAMFAGMVDGLSEACAAMGDCCEAGVTANSDFALCTEESLVALNLTLPDYGALVPGGVPDLDALLTGTATTAAAADVTTVAAAKSTEAGDSTTVVTTTVAAATLPAEVTMTTVAAVTLPAEVTTTTVAAVTIPADEVTTTTVAATATTSAAAPKDAASTTSSGSYAYAINVALSFTVTLLLAVHFVV